MLYHLLLMNSYSNSYVPYSTNDHYPAESASSHNMVPLPTLSIH